MALQITQEITALPEIPSRQDRDNFPEQISTFWSGEKNLSEQLGTWTMQANAVAAEVNDNAERAEAAAETAETYGNASLWDFGGTYDFDDGTENPMIAIGAGAQAYRSLTNNNTENCPHAHNQVEASAASCSIAEVVTQASTENKTYVLKIKAWAETGGGSQSLSIRDGNGDNVVSAAVALTTAIKEFSVTASMPTGSAADIEVKVEDDDITAAQTYGVYAAFLYEISDPDTNLLTGDGGWQLDLTGWDTSGCSIVAVDADTAKWAHIQALPSVAGQSGKALFNDGVSSYWGIAPSPIFVSYAILTAQDTSTFTAGARRIREIDQIAADPDGIVSLLNNVFTLQAGTYFIEWQAPAVGTVKDHCSWLYNITDSEDAIDGSMEYCYQNAYTQTRSHGMDRITITQETEFRIEHRCEASGKFGEAGSGWGGYLHLFIKIFKEAS